MLSEFQGIQDFEQSALIMAKFGCSLIFSKEHLKHQGTNEIIAKNMMGDIAYYHAQKQSFNKDLKPLLQFVKKSKALHFVFIYGDFIEADFRTITPIKFQFLVELDLSNNQLRNIEGLTFLDAPELRSINLTNNKLANTIIPTINKLYFKKLQLIELSGNQFYQTSFFQTQTYKGDKIRFFLYGNTNDMPKSLRKEKISRQSEQTMASPPNSDNSKQQNLEQFRKISHVN